MRAAAGRDDADTVALCGGNCSGDYIWMLDAVDYATTWVSTRAMWNRGQEGTVAALADLEQCLPFPLLGLETATMGANFSITMCWPGSKSGPGRSS